MIKSIYTKNYRNIPDINVELSPSINLIIAPNGSGKTNFLECLYLASTASTFRPIVSFADIVGPTEEYAKVNLTKDNDEVEYVISVSNEKLSRKFKLNTKITSIGKLTTKLPFILFAPQSVNLVAGEPQIRRDDIDNFLSYTLNGYYADVSKYRTLLKNRNALLKHLRDHKAQIKELDYWTEQISLTGTKIFKARNDFFEETSDFMKDEAFNIFHDFKSFDVKYLPNTESDPDKYYETILQKYKENVEKEIIVGKTLYGCHKDDFELLLNNRNLRYFGSRGQQRIGAFILKLAQHKYLKKFNEINPSFLLDDVFSELDPEHREKLSQIFLDLNEQVFITTADINEVPEKLKKEALVIDISK